MTSPIIYQHHEPVDVSNLLGHWVNVNHTSDFIASLDLDINGAQLVMNIVLAQPDYRGEQRISVEPVAAETQLAGGFSHYQVDGELTIAANEKNGVLVLQSYRPVKVEGSTTLQLTREFYYRQTKATHTGSVAQFRNHPPQLNRHFTDKFAMLMGTWNNTNTKTSWVEQFTISDQDGKLSMTAHSAAQDHQWSATQLIPYFFDGEEFGFVAHSQTERISSLFTSYSNKGLIVVSAFHRVKTSGAQSVVKPFFVREFYAKQLP